MNFEEALEILRIQPETELTPAVITTAFRASILTWHPDKNPSVDTTEKSRQILEARDELMKYLDTRRFADNATDEAAKPQPEGSDRAAEAKVSKRFPPVIHVIQGSPEDEGFEDTYDPLYIKTVCGQSIRVMISCGRSTPLFKPRSMHEALILTYLSCHPEQTIEALIESLGKTVAAKGSSPAKSDVITIAESSSGLIIITGQPKLASLTDLEIDQLMDQVGLRWIIMGNKIKASSAPMCLSDLSKLTIGGHLVLNAQPRLKEADGEPTKLELTNGAELAGNTQNDKSAAFVTVLDYIDNTWHGIPPKGIQQMRKAAEVNSSDKEFFDAIKAIASERLEETKKIASKRGIFAHVQMANKNKKADQFYKKVIGAENLDELGREITTPNKGPTSAGGGGAAATPVTP